MPRFKKEKAGLYVATIEGHRFELRREAAGYRNRSWWLWETASPAHPTESLIDSNIQTLADGERALVFVLSVDAHVQSLGAVGSGPYRWTLETRLGPLYVKAGADHVFMRFEDVERARPTLGDRIGNSNHFNPYSGKWNMHWHRGTDNGVMLHNFQRQLARVVQEVAA